MSSSSSSSSSSVATTERRRGQVPFLFLSAMTSSEEKSRNHYLYLYDFVQEKITRKFHLLKDEIDERYILSSSEGFLFSLEKSSQEIHATNPLTGSHLLLPSIASFPNVTGILRTSTGTITQYVYHNDNDHDDEPKIDLYLFQGKADKGKGMGSSFPFQRIDPTRTLDINKIYQAVYYSKAILSPSLDNVVVIHGLYPAEEQLAIAQVGQTPCPSSWTPLHKSNLPSSATYVDIIFHQGRLHALDSNCALTIFDIDNPLPLAPPLFCPPAVYPLPLKSRDRLTQIYLVESSNGHDLFLVYRELKRVYDINGKLELMTMTFKVYKLDKSNECCYKWEQVETIGDLAFFVGYNHSISLSAHDFPPGLLKPNSIYFTDAYFLNDRIVDNGVFRLEDGSFHFYKINDAIHKFHKVQPIWLMPPATCSS